MWLRCSHVTYTATHCNTLQHTATHCYTLQHTATHCKSLQPTANTATHCNTLQSTATHCNTLQHTVMHWNTATYSTQLASSFPPGRNLPCGNDLYHSCTSFEGASWRGQPLNIFTWSIGSGGVWHDSQHINNSYAWLIHMWLDQWHTTAWFIHMWLDQWHTTAWFIHTWHAE